MTGDELRAILTTLNVNADRLSDALSAAGYRTDPQRIRLWRVVPPFVEKFVAGWLESPGSIPAGRRQRRVG